MGSTETVFNASTRAISRYDLLDELATRYNLTKEEAHAEVWAYLNQVIGWRADFTKDGRAVEDVAQEELDITDDQAYAIFHSVEIGNDVDRLKKRVQDVLDGKLYEDEDGDYGGPAESSMTLRCMTEVRSLPGPRKHRLTKDKNMAEMAIKLDGARDRGDSAGTGRQGGGPGPEPGQVHGRWARANRRHRE